MNGSPLSPMSSKRRAALAAAGNTNPWSTLTNRSSGLARTAGLGRAAGGDRKPTLKTTTPKDTGPDAATVALVIGRDEGRCVRCGLYVTHLTRGVDWSVQHRRGRGSGGDRRPDTNQAHNLLVLCGDGTTGCHGWVEHNPAAADEHGWAISRWADPALERVDHHLHGLVWLTPDGGFTRQAPAVAS